MNAPVQRSAKRLSMRQRFAVPMVIALTSFAGLIMGLTGEGWRDALAITLLLTPLSAMIIAWRRRN